MNNTIKLWLISVALAGCAHEAAFGLSKGHIDSGQPTKGATLGEIPKPVKNNAFLPAPKPKAKEQTYSVVVNDVPVHEILFALARESKMNVDIQPGITGNVTLNAVDQPLLAILERISKQVNLIYKSENNVLVISPDLPVLRTYQINYLNIERNTKGGISVTNQLASAGGGAEATGKSNGDGGASGQNNSTTSVESVSNNHFWDNLEKNIKEILAESDKQVVISRLDSDARMQNEYQGNASGTGNIAIDGSKEKLSKNGDTSTSSGSAKGGGNETISASNSEAAQKSLKSYQTLFAASIISNRETGVLSIRATQKQHEKINEFINKVQAGARRQVMIEASIVEVALNDQFSAGIDWSRLGPNGLTFNQSLSGGSLTGSSSKFVVGFANKTVLGTLAGSIRLLEGFGKTKVLSSPKLMVLNSQTAVLKVVDNLVWFKVSVIQPLIGVSGTIIPPTYTTTANTMPVGVWMSVTPQINENDVVTLDVRPTIARKVGDVIDPNPALSAAVPNKIPQIQVREMASILQIPSGSTAVLGGLMQDEISRSDNDVPVASKVPFFGKLFQSKDDTTKKTELVIFLRPTVITNASLESEELKSFKQYLPDQLPETAADEPAH